MKTAVKASLIGIIFVLPLAGCTEVQKSDEALSFEDRPVIKAFYATSPVRIDGRLDEEVWQEAKAYELNIPVNKYEEGGELMFGGKAKVAWDEYYLYIGIEFEDDDIVAQMTEDEMHHYRGGDVCELFVKPERANWYWELYVTPRGNKTNMFWPSRGYLSLPDQVEEYTSGLKVGAQVYGTLNNWRDTDQKWTAEMAMPVADLSEAGVGFGPGEQWTIFIARYNYSQSITSKGAEHSSVPQISRVDWHLLEEYGRIEFAGD
jgi:hypothetical protein